MGVVSSHRRRSCGLEPVSRFLVSAGLAGMTQAMTQAMCPVSLFVLFVFFLVFT